MIRTVAFGGLFRSYTSGNDHVGAVLEKFFGHTTIG